MSLANYLKQPQNFLYIYASDGFINKLGRTHAYVIKRKKQNQKKLLTTAAGGAANYNNAFNQMAKAFKDTFSVTPQQALITLAEGGEIAGKDWSKGIYGIGKTEYPVNFSGQGVDSSITIDANGQFYKRSYDGSGAKILTTEIVSYGKDGNPNCVRYTDPSGNVYTANYNKKHGWYAGQCALNGGQIYQADGQIGGASYSANIWESVVLSISKIVEWLVSLFNATTGEDKELLTAANTQPSQGDGWVYESGVSPAVLIAVGLGTLVAAGGFGGFLKSAKKSKK